MGVTLCGYGVQVDFIFSNLLRDVNQPEVRASLMGLDEHLCRVTCDGETTTGSGNRSALLPALRRRLDPHGTRGIRVQQDGPNRVEILVPTGDASEYEQVKKVRCLVL